MPTLQRIRSRFQGLPAATLVGMLCAWMAAPGQAISQEPPPQATRLTASEGTEVPEVAEKLTNDQLDSLVAPVALYPDPLLAQCLVASTYPIDVVAAQQWLDKNSSLKGDALAKEAENQPWDPSVQALVSIPDALKRLSENIAWTKDLGDAFLAQQSDVMDAVQRLRVKAKDGGKLESSDQQKVEVQTVESKQVIVIEPSSPEVVYVPSYSPTVIWGAPAYYPYPPHVLPALLRRRGLDRIRSGNRRRNRDQRRLGLGLRLARRRQHHQHQQQQQLRQSSTTGRTTSTGAETATGSTMPSSAAARLTRTGLPRTSTAAGRGATRCSRGRDRRNRARVRAPTAAALE